MDPKADLLLDQVCFVENIFFCKIGEGRRTFVVAVFFKY